MSDAEKKDQMKKVNGIFEMHVTKDGKESVYTIDLKKVREKPVRRLVPACHSDSHSSSTCHTGRRGQAGSGEAQGRWCVNYGSDSLGS